VSPNPKSAASREERKGARSPEIAELVSVIIPHYNGKDVLGHCLDSLARCTYDPLEVIVVDNGSSDGSPEFVRTNYPEVKVVVNAKNLGYAGGCNAGARVAQGSYLLFLNNDTTHKPDWIDRLVEVLRHDHHCAAVQPKILSYQNRRRFDYSGAAGGLLDRYGYPFALGRIFTTLEEDHHQYDQPRRIFWASGTAFLVRREAFEAIGGFDESYFAHMEEIDLCWRLQQAGWTIQNAPAAEVIHFSGWTLPPDRYLKKYLNHRNSLMMIVKNYPRRNLLYILPLRLVLEGVAWVFSLFIGDWKRCIAIPHAVGWLIVHLKEVLKKNEAARSFRKPDAVSRTLRRLYPRPVFYEYFLRRKKYAYQLLDPHFVASGEYTSARN